MYICILVDMNAFINISMCMYVAVWIDILITYVCMYVCVGCFSV